MKHDTPASDGHWDQPMSASRCEAPPVAVFYVVQSSGVVGERAHRLCSDLYETRLQAEAELARRRDSDPGSGYGVWKSVTYVEPAEWLHRVVRTDGTLILPRLHGVEKIANA
jgi:hypothetical protein